jgi:hypothetical protein
VRYHPGRGELGIDGWVNMREGLVEVFPAPAGQDARGGRRLTAFRAVCTQSPRARLHQGTPVEFGTDGTYRAPTGDPVTVLVRWIDLVERRRGVSSGRSGSGTKDERVMDRGDWIFAGSFMQEVSDDSSQSTYAANYVKSP